VEIICCVVDGTPLPIIHTHNGDGTFQNEEEVIVKQWVNSAQYEHDI